ncbi:MAG: CpaF family protein [Clostridiales bacterium]
MDNKESLTSKIKKIISNKVDFKKKMTDEEIKEIILNEVFEESKNIYLSVYEKQDIVNSVFNSFRRLDVLQPILDDDTVTEIMVNGYENIFVEREGRVKRVNVKFESNERLEQIITNIVGSVNREVNEFKPIVDARLKDGSRVNVTLAPIAINGPILTIRKFSKEVMTVDKLIRYGSITKEISNVLKNLVKARYNIFICGGTGSGKTTFLNALSNFIPNDDRVVTIEDSAELQIIGIDNIVKLETRNANTAGTGMITIRDLIKTSLRMRPDRIIVGEVRGAEALDMLQAMNTGHDGSLSTGHANSSQDMLSRIETMVLSGAELPLEAIRQQITSAIDIIINLGRLRDKTRRTLGISEVEGYKDGKIILNSLYKFEEESEAEDGRIIGGLKRTENKLIHTDKLKVAGISSDF